jgi:hypothetical protein
LPRKRKAGAHKPHSDEVQRASIGSQITDASGFYRGMTVRALLPKATKAKVVVVKTKKIRKPPEAWEFTDENPYG